MLYHTEPLPPVTNSVCVHGNYFLMEKLSLSQGTDCLSIPIASRGRAGPGLLHQCFPFSSSQGLDFSPEIGGKGPETSSKTQKEGWDLVLISFLSIHVCVTL